MASHRHATTRDENIRHSLALAEPATRGWLVGALLGVLAVSTPVLLCGCPPGDSVGETGVLTAADDCDEDLQSDTLAEFARKCAAATGEDVPAFNCDDGTLVPEEHLSGSGASQRCDAPNVLVGECDPGSRFQVLKQTADVSIVAHCRKQRHGDGLYGDIAVIQYNQKNGATCFYQALGDLSAHVTAPSEGNGPGKFPWKNPGGASSTAEIMCVQCHDNGPFVRSPYLAQLRNEATNRLPGTNAGSGPWDQRFLWNKTLPYKFVGNDFQSWKAFSVTVTGAGAGCTGCHRLGINSVHGVFLSKGTAQVLGLTATAPTQLQKNPHSADSPIWMTPGQIIHSAANETEAQAMAACAKAIVARANNPNAAPPPSGCQWVQIAQGDTCRGGAIRGVLNGATQSEPSSDRSDVVVELGPCLSGECPPGFCYWRTVHGPFWQTTPSSIPIGDDKYRGSFVRIYTEGGIWKSRAFSDPTGGPPNAPPGGTVECTIFSEIAAVPDPGKCFGNLFTVTDPDGTHLAESVNASLAGPTTVNELTGLIGNVAQSNTLLARSESPDFLRVNETGGKVLLSEAHGATPPSPLQPGPLVGESWTLGCNGWTADYAVKDVYTTSDVQLVAAGDSKNVRCFITGVTGAWSSTRNGTTLQPFAEIYTGSSKDTRLRVSPTSGGDRVGAYASCIRLK